MINNIQGSRQRKMAAAYDVEDLVTCGVCLNEYDDVDRKPKFLQCAHTVCLVCLKEMCQGDLIKCPFCRETFVKFDVRNLPNNPYALHMLKFKEEKELPKPVEVVANPLAVSWCLTCGSVEKPGCDSSGHSLVDMSADTIRSLEGLLKLKEEMLKMKDTRAIKLTMAIQERKKVEEHFALILKAIQNSEKEIKKLQNENSIQMNQMISVLERSGSKIDSQDGQPKEELLFSELMSLVGGSTTGDSTKTLKQKMTHLIELYEQNLCEAKAIASEHELRQKVKIAVHLYDENDKPIPTVPWLEKGFQCHPVCPTWKGSLARQDLLLVSHAIFSLLQRQEIQLKLKPETTAVVSLQPPTPIPIAANIFKKKKKEKKVATKSEPQLTNCAHNASTTSSSIPPTIATSSTKFVLSQSSIFTLKVYQFGIPKGELNIRPALTFEHPEFIQKLGQFCFKFPKSLTVEKSSPKQYVSFSIKKSYHPEFEPIVTGVIGKFAGKSNEEIPAKTAVFGEFGIYLDTQSISCIGIPSGSICINTLIKGWNFLLPLEAFRTPQNEVAHSKMDYVPLGRVIYLSDAFIQLASANKFERTDYTITLESQ